MIKLFRVILLVLIVLSIYFSLTSSGAIAAPRVWDKLLHAVGYFALLMALDFSFKPGEHLLAKIVTVFVYSGLIEVAQGFLTSRDASMADMLANGVGIALFCLLVPLLHYLHIYQRLRLS